MDLSLFVSFSVRLFVCSRSSLPEVFRKKGALGNFAKFTEKHLWHTCFPLNFAKFLRTLFFWQNTSGGCFCCSQRKIVELAHQFFLIFCIKLESHKIRQVMDPDFWKKLERSEGKKNIKRYERWGFQGFDKNEIHTYVLFWECAIGLLTLCKDDIFGKNLRIES